MQIAEYDDDFLLVAETFANGGFVPADSVVVDFTHNEALVSVSAMADNDLRDAVKELKRAGHTVKLLIALGAGGVGIMVPVSRITRAFATKNQEHAGYADMLVILAVSGTRAVELLRESYGRRGV